MRALLTIALLTLAGCAGQRTLTHDETFEALSTRTLSLHLDVANAHDGWASLTLLVDVHAASATWASLVRIPGWSGEARRTRDGMVQLTLDTYESCRSGLCSIDVDITLDAAPTEPWSAVVSLSVAADFSDDGRVGVIQRP